MDKPTIIEEPEHYMAIPCPSPVLYTRERPKITKEELLARINFSRNEVLIDVK
jgi:predicted secreted protein